MFDSVEHMSSHAGRPTVRTALTTVKAGWKQASAQNASLLGAGVAFYMFLSLFPALIAGVLTYGLVASPETVQKQANRLSDALPADAASVVTGQLESLTQTSSSSLGVGLVIAVVLALYSASSGIANLIVAVNAMYGYTDQRGFLKKKLIAFGLTAGAIITAVVLLGLVAVAPAVLDSVVDVLGVRALLEAARWVILLGALVLAIGVLLRVAPDRPDDTRPPLLSRGVVVAAALWAVVSLLFSLYVDNFGSYGKTYGALAGVVVLLLWLWAGLYALLLGACIEAVREEKHDGDVNLSPAASEALAG